MQDNIQKNNNENEAARKKSAMLTAIAVMMYILSPLALIISYLLNVQDFAIIGIPTLIVMVAIATGLLIYNSMTKPNYIKESDELMEEFREWKEENKERKTMRSAISSTLWTLLIATYFIISFTSGAWHLTWIIFLIGAAIESLINVFVNLRK